MPTRGRLAAVTTDAVRRMGSAVGLTPFDRTMLVMLRRPEWLVRGRGRLPAGRLEFRPPRPVADEDRALCERLVDAYRRATGGADRAASTTGMWAWIFSERQRRLAEALERGDPGHLAALLAGMLRSEFVVGMAYGDLVGDPRPRLGARLWWLKTLDNLASLAEALGVVPTENPEQGGVGIAFERGLGDLVARIERHLGCDIAFPDVGAPYGIRAGTTLIPPDWPEQLYAAWRLADAMERHAAGTRVVEIGAGYGAMAYALLTLRPDVEHYAVVDLPIVNVLQGYFLAKALGAEQVSLFGEPPARLAVVPNHALDTVPTPCDVVVNKDSMPEMPEAAMLDYLRWTKAECTGLFFSYNQEAQASFGGERQNLVPDAVAAVGGFDRLRRDVSWVRRGYVEEIYARVAATP
jgi:hypothetical protein